MMKMRSQKSENASAERTRNDGEHSEKKRRQFWMKKIWT